MDRPAGEHKRIPELTGSGQPMAMEALARYTSG